MSTVSKIKYGSIYDACTPFGTVKIDRLIFPNIKAVNILSFQIYI